MLSSILRTSARRTTLARRHVATKAEPSASSSSVASHVKLPEAKMRALISLYHQADSFITPENLSAHIDDVFVNKKALDKFHDPDERSLTNLWRELNIRRSLPKVGDGKDLFKQSHARSSIVQKFSGVQDIRGSEVRNALYGTEDAGKPGLEVLEEEHERIQSHIRRDRERQS